MALDVRDINPQNQSWIMV